jgi:O-antigen ligase
MIFLLLLFGLGLFLLPKSEGEGVNLLRTYSLTSRAFSTITAWEWFTDRPLWGMGFNAYKWVAVPVHEARQIPSLPSGPDNSFVLVLATTGIIGFSIFSIYIIMLFMQIFRKKWILLSLSLILIHSLTNNSWFYPWVMVWVSLMLADTAHEAKADRKQ